MKAASRTSLFGAKSVFESFNSQTNGTPSHNGFLSQNSSLKRRSTLTTAASSKRRQSLHGPSQSNSQQTPILSQSSSQQTPSSQIIADQRPLRDKNYINLITQEIYDFLISHAFESKTDYPLTQKMLRSPTQKDFTMMFKFIYNRLDPSHEFSKAMDIEVFSLLRQMNYPYLDTINRSQISAVGGQNWPVFLGMLYWLVKMDLKHSALLSQSGTNSILWKQEDANSIAVNYVRKRYRDFLYERDSHDDDILKFDQDLDRVKTKVIEEIEVQKQRLNESKHALELAKEQELELKRAETKTKALEDDFVTFKAYIETIENRKVQWANSIEKIKTELNNYEEEAKKKEQEKLDLQEQLKSQNIVLDELDKINLEREKLLNSIDSLNDDNQKINSILQSTEIELVKNYQSIENFIKNYNNIINKTKQAADRDFHLKLNPEIIIDRQVNPDKAFQPDEIINKSLKQEKISLIQFNRELAQNVNEYLSKFSELEDTVNNLREKIAEKTEGTDSINAKIMSLKSTYEENYENMINSTTQLTTEVEKLEREMTTIKIKIDQEYIQLENQLQNTSMAYDKLVHETTRSRTELSAQCDKLSSSVSHFILENRTNLLQFLDFVDQECQSEINNEN